MDPCSAHVRTLLEERGFDRPEFALGDLLESYVSQAFACTDQGGEFAEAVDDGRSALVTVGVSMTGPPHLGTLGQLLTAVRLQRAGLDVQLILADLAAHLAGGHDLAAVRERAARYRAFAHALGFDSEDGTLRTQEQDRETMHAAMLLSRAYGDADEADPDEADADGGGDDPGPTAFEEALADAYERADTPGRPTPVFAGQQTGLLLTADTLAPLMDGYDAVCFVGGADNHGLSGWFRTVLDRSRYDGTVAGLYTPLVPGLGGVPKMSKSIPASCVTMAYGADAIREAVRELDDGGGDPATSPVYRLACLASKYTVDELDAMREQCASGDEPWGSAVDSYADDLVVYADHWC